MNNKSFAVPASTSLVLEDLWAKVVIQRGPANQITLEMTGEQKIIDKIKVVQESSGVVSLKGELENNTIISTSGSISISGNVRGVVIVNGKIISGGNDNVLKADQIPEIMIKIPEKTSLEITDVQELIASNIFGKVRVNLGGQKNVYIKNAVNAKIKCSGQSSCQLEEVIGQLNVEASGQSRIQALGNFEDVEAEASGQSTISILGNCSNFDAEASGQSSIGLNGTISGKMRKRTSGLSRISC